MKRADLLGALIACLLAAAIAAVAAEPSSADGAASFEVWAIDQNDTKPLAGGTLYVYEGDDLGGQDAATATPEVIDLGGAATELCLATTGSAPRRPHMLMFNEAHSHAVLAWVATGHVLFLDGATRTPLACIDVGAQAHAAFPSPDERYVIVANQNGKLLQRIWTDYATNTFTLDSAATLDLANGTTPNGASRQDPALRPDNAPICPVVDSTSRFTFVTLRGGGMFVVDSLATPMAIVAEYDQAIVHPNGCGGVEADGKMYINSGGGTATNPLESDLYMFPLSGFDTTPNAPNTPAPTVVFSHDARGFVDSHGAVLTKGERFLWVADRAANRIVVVDTASDVVVNEIELAGPVSPDPAPDLMDISPSGNRVFMALRGPTPLTGNAPGVNNAAGTTPGVGVLRVEKGGRDGVFQALAPITRPGADPHALAVRLK